MLKRMNEAINTESMFRCQEAEVSEGLCIKIETLFW